MSNFRKELLADVSKLCREMFSRRLARVREQQLVSEKSKEDILVLVLELDRFRQLNPFPTKASLDLSPLEQLKRDLAAADADEEASQLILLDWVRAARPEIDVEEEATPEGEPYPINQRMIDSLSEVRSAIDKTRTRLMLSGDSYDRPAYTAARNAFTLAREVYAERLRCNQIECTNEDCSEVEQVLKPAIEEADGAAFPGSIETVADFIEVRTFPDAETGKA